MDIQEAMNIVYPPKPPQAQGQQALDAALFERAKADRYETALRRALLLLDKNDRWAAAVVIRNALLP